MVQVDFHSGVADKIGYACRLLRKAHRAGHRVAVVGPGEHLARLDVMLWTFDPGEFVPHCRLRAGQVLPAHLHRTPIVLLDDAASLSGQPVVVNLGSDGLHDLSPFDRVIEVVTAQADDAAQARARWRRYAAAGHKPTNHDQSGR